MDQAALVPQKPSWSYLLYRSLSLPSHLVLTESETLRYYRYSSFWAWETLSGTNAIARETLSGTNAIARETLSGTNAIAREVFSGTNTIARETLSGTVATLPSGHEKHSQVLSLPFLLGTGNTHRYYHYSSLQERETLSGTIATLSSGHGKHSQVLLLSFLLGTGNTPRYYRNPSF